MLKRLSGNLKRLSPSLDILKRSRSLSPPPSPKTNNNNNNSPPFDQKWKNEWKRSEIIEYQNCHLFHNQTIQNTRVPVNEEEIIYLNTQFNYTAPKLCEITDPYQSLADFHEKIKNDWKQIYEIVPRDILIYHMFPYLSATDTVHLNQTCRGWKYFLFINDKLLWKSRIEKIIGYNIIEEQVQKKGYSYRILFLKFFEKYEQAWQFENWFIDCQNREKAEEILRNGTSPGKTIFFIRPSSKENCFALSIISEKTENVISHKIIKKKGENEYVTANGEIFPSLKRVAQNFEKIKSEFIAYPIKWPIKNLLWKEEILNYKFIHYFPYFILSKDDQIDRFLKFQKKEDFFLKMISPMKRVETECKAFGCYYCATIPIMEVNIWGKYMKNYEAAPCRYFWEKLLLINEGTPYPYEYCPLHRCHFPNCLRISTSWKGEYKQSKHSPLPHCCFHQKV